MVLHRSALVLHLYYTGALLVLQWHSAGNVLVHYWYWTGTIIIPRVMLWSVIEPNWDATGAALAQTLADAWRTLVLYSFCTGIALVLRWYVPVLSRCETCSTTAAPFGAKLQTLPTPDFAPLLGTPESTSQRPKRQS